MNNFRRFAAILVFSLLLLACSGETPAESKTGASGGSLASGIPTMSEADLDKYLADHNDKGTILMFWATWCPSCKQAMPELEGLMETHGDKVNILAVSLDESADALKRFYSDKTTNLSVFHGDLSLAQKFKVEAIPTMVIFDKSGQVVFARPGVFSREMLGALADKLVE